MNKKNDIEYRLNQKLDDLLDSHELASLDAELDEDLSMQIEFSRYKNLQAGLEKLADDFPFSDAELRASRQNIMEAVDRKVQAGQQSRVLKFLLNPRVASLSAAAVLLFAAVGIWLAVSRGKPAPGKTDNASVAANTEPKDSQGSVDNTTDKSGGNQHVDSSQPVRMLAVSNRALIKSVAGKGVAKSQMLVSKMTMQKMVEPEKSPIDDNKPGRIIVMLSGSADDSDKQALEKKSRVSPIGYWPAGKPG